MGEVENQNPIAVKIADDSALVRNVTNETISYQYNFAGALSSADGQPAGTLIYSKTAYDGFLSAFKDQVGDVRNTSFSFTAGVTLTNLITTDIDKVVDNLRGLSVTEKFTKIGTYLKNNGDYWVDHQEGAIWGKAGGIVVVNDFVNYSYKAPVRATDPVTASGNIAQVGGIDVPNFGTDGEADARAQVPTGSHISGFNGLFWDRIRAGITTFTNIFTGFLNTLPWAIYNAAPGARADGEGGPLEADSAGNLRIVEQYAPGYEDNTNNVAKVEHRYSTSGVLTADTQVKGSAGFVHTITIAPNDILPTAGNLDVYDNTVTGGTKIFSMYIPAALFNPFTVTLDVSCANGIYVDFTTTADVNAFVSYR